MAQVSSSENCGIGLFQFDWDTVSNTNEMNENTRNYIDNNPFNDDNNNPFNNKSSIIPKPFTFNFNFSGSFDVDNDNKNDKKEEENEENEENKEEKQNELIFQFSFPNKTKSESKRRIKLPEFDKISVVTKELNLLRQQIKEQKLALNKLKEKESELISSKNNINNDINNWYKGWKKWCDDDFIEWIFFIENGYFKLKQNDNKPFVKYDFIYKLNQIVNRFGSKKKEQQFEGKHILKFDILDLKELCKFLNGDDCRKLFAQIQILTKSERNKNKIDQFCTICTQNQKQYALSCGHIFCKKCIDKIEKCALCNKSIQKNGIRKIYL